MLNNSIGVPLTANAHLLVLGTGGLAASGTPIVF